MAILGIHLTKAWVATVFCVARTHLARPDFSAHAHVCAPSFYDGRTSHPHAHLFCSKSNLEDTFIKKSLQKICKLLKTFLFKTQRFWNMIILSFDFLHTQKKNLCMQKKQNKEKIWLFSNKIRKISNFCLKSGQNVWSHVCGVWPAQKWSRAHTSHTCFKSLFARTRTRATAHRTCACAHAPSQPIPCKLRT